jgi:hypothetical protein
MGIVVAFFWGHEGWFHLELFQVSEAISQPAHNSTLFTQLAVIFSWKEAFDANANRLRPFSEVVEVIDGVMRPLRLFGHHPSLTVVSLVLAVGTILAFHRALRRMDLPGLPAVLLTFLMITTVGYLSCFVPYIRPAKKLALFCTTLTLLFSANYRVTQRSFPQLWFSVFLAFYCDEAGFLLWPVSILLVGPTLAKQRRWQSGALLLSLPVFSALGAKWIIPAIYSLAGHPRNPAPDAAAFLVTFLLAPRFYCLAAQDLASGLLVSMGIAGPGKIAIGLALALITGLVVYGIWKRQWLIVSACLCLIAMSFGLSLFDMYNSPFHSAPFGQLTYYYHSPIGVLAIFALATLKLPTKVLAPLVILVALSNVRNFYAINRAIMIEHNYPFEARSLPKTDREPEKLAREFYRLTPRFAGLNQDWFETNFAHYRLYPIANDDFPRRFRALFDPHNAPRP